MNRFYFKDNPPDSWTDPIICERCGDDGDGPWVPLDDGRLLCEACWEKRTT